MALESTQPPAQWVPMALLGGQSSQNVKLSNPPQRVHKSRVTKFCKAAPFIFSIITEVLPPPITHKCAISSHAPNRIHNKHAQITPETTVHSMEPASCKPSGA